jgi:uncharacterized protein HemX
MKHNMRAAIGFVKHLRDWRDYAGFQIDLSMVSMTASMTELERLNAQQEEEFSWDAVREIEQVEGELEATHKAVFELSERVRQTWA